MIAYGPVPSRRLGQSMGINNIPPKYCTYSCVYCQVGRTLNIEVEPHVFYEPEKVISDIREKVDKTMASGEEIDYISFVPDGEPTLDVNLGQEIRETSKLGIKTAVISNASLLWREDIRERLMDADWVSVKVDSIGEKIWRKVNRPHKDLDLSRIKEGILSFAEVFQGELTTETMLVKGLNDSESNATQIAGFLEDINPAVSYISIPTRPPAEKDVHISDEEAINMFYQIFSASVGKVEHLIGYEGNTFAFTGDVKEDLLGITAVHPMREEGIEEFLRKANETWDPVNKLLKEGRLKTSEYEGKTYFVRSLPSSRSQA